ncbi:MAG: hypothetical protein ABW072_00305 [Sedimenticola sp.]
MKVIMDDDLFEEWICEIWPVSGWETDDQMLLDVSSALMQIEVVQKYTYYCMPDHSIDFETPQSDQLAFCYLILKALRRSLPADLALPGKAYII